MGLCYKCMHACSSDDPCPCCRPVISGTSGFVVITSELPVCAHDFDYDRTVIACKKCGLVPSDGKAGT